MFKVLCEPPKTHKEKNWDYQQYYTGDKDKEGRRNGEGSNHWSGAKSLEYYNGHFTRDTMHGVGDYLWRHRGPENAFITYEGHFYCNHIHGYGTMSYPNGRTFNGLFLNNVRWGPGKESHANLHEDVGLWRGSQLVRLTWHPVAPSIVPDFMSNSSGRSIVETHRVVLQHNVENLGEINTALELLKRCGADPRLAVQKWKKLYPKYCTDIASPLCHVDSFHSNYYTEKIQMLQETECKLDDKEGQNEEITYYAWNNNKMIINIMKHSYKHESQRNNSIVDLKSILSGPRTMFKPAGDYELQCRSLLMMCYLGHIANVAELINENRISPDVSDVQGNSAIMYAVCGDQPDIIHFLIEAGGHVDYYNDSCCTPLGIALMRYSCIQNDIPFNGMLQALLPPPMLPAPLPIEQKVFEWNIIRDTSTPSNVGTMTKTPSKTRNMSSKKIKSLLSIEPSAFKRKTEPLPLLPNIQEVFEDSNEPLSEVKKLYNDINQEFCIKVTDIFTFITNPTPFPYIFDIYDVSKDVETIEEDKKQSDKSDKKVPTKATKDTVKASKEMILGDGNKREEESIDSHEKEKKDTLSKIMLTIIQLLSDGANPRLVRCPQPALLIAITSNSPDLISHLVNHGADVNETYQHIFDYFPIDVALSRPYTRDNLEIVKALLDCGANTNHKLLYKQETKDLFAPEVTPGPTLLHAVLGRKVENDIGEDIRHQLLELLLDYNCDPIKQFKGRSAMDVAMTKSIEVIEIFIKNSKTDLNAIINEANQNVLVKMFFLPFFRSISTIDRYHILTNLLLHGSDPLIKCQNGKDIYENIFVFTKRTLSEMENTQVKAGISTIGKQDLKAKKDIKPKKEEKLSTKSLGKMTIDEVEDYKQSIELVADCARLIYIRWLQGKLVKELIETIDKYKHRHWNIILKEFSGRMNIGLWLTPQRCIEIWDIFYSFKKKKYSDFKILRYLLCIVIYMSWHNYGQLHSDELSGQNITASLKDAIESDVKRLLRQCKVNNDLKSEISSWKFIYVKPELIKDAKKFNVCFECMLPLHDNKIKCCWCEFISFCSYECIKMNINRANCHPCRDFIKSKYFPSPEDSIAKNIF